MQISGYFRYIALFFLHLFTDEDLHGSFATPSNGDTSQCQSLSGNLL